MLEPEVHRARQGADIDLAIGAAAPVRDRLVSAYTLGAVDAADRVLDDTRRKKPRPSPKKRLEPGEVGDPIEIGSEVLSRLLVRILAPKGEPRRALWHQADSEAVVLLDKTRAVVLDGFVLIGVTLQTDQTGAEELTVPISVSTAERLTGMLAATESVPRGHSALAQVWGEGVTALAWETLLKLADLVMTLSGTDVDGNPLRIGTLIAEQDNLAFVPQARHRNERLGGPPAIPELSPKNDERQP